MADETILGAAPTEGDATNNESAAATAADETATENPGGGESGTPAPDAEGSENGGANEKPEDGETDEGKGGDNQESYEAFTMPDGMEVDEALVGRFTPVAKELELDQAGAQKLVDLFAEIQAEAAEAQTTSWNAMQEQWAEDAKGDKEMGGDKWDETVSLAARARDKFGTPALKDALNATGAGNHPELIRFFARIGRLVGEDGFVSGETKPAPKTTAEVMYPNS